MSETPTSAAALRNVRRFNTNGNHEVNPKQAEAIENNRFLRNVIDKLDHEKNLSAENVAKLRKMFSSLSKFRGLDKYLYEVTISLGTSRNPELISLAQEFNTALIAR